MAQKTSKPSKVSKRGLTPTMVQKSEKQMDYIYKLSNGTYLSFPNKNFPEVKDEPLLNQTPDYGLFKIN